jgi:hypothetical protein
LHHFDILVALRFSSYAIIIFGCYYIFDNGFNHIVFAAKIFAGRRQPSTACVLQVQKGAKMAVKAGQD